MRRAISLVLTLCLSTGSAAWARGTAPGTSIDLAAINESLATNLRSPQPDALLKDAGVSRTKQLGAEIGQTVLFLLAATALDVFIAKLAGQFQQSDDKKKESLLVASVDEVLN